MCTVPFGFPVDPEEYSQKQGASQVVSTVWKRLAAADISSPKSRVPSMPAPAATTMCLTVGTSLTMSLNCGQSCFDTTRATAPLSRSMYW